MRKRLAFVVTLLAFPVAAWSQVLRVPLEYRAPGDGAKPNFSPVGTKVPLTDVAADAVLPSEATRPARTGTMMIGPTGKAWVGVLATSDREHPLDLCRIYVDRNRNGRFDDDGPPLTATPTQNEKTKAWWTSLKGLDLTIPYPGRASAEPYQVDVWLVRESETPPDVLRYSVRSWRSGTVNVNGTDALVAVMDSNNDALFDNSDYWSVLEADAPDAPRAVLSSKEARSTDRLMFVRHDGREQVLEFRGVQQDGSSIDMAVVDRPISKDADRGADDVLAAERTRPRTTEPFAWSRELSDAVAHAKAANKLVLVEFEASWCGPCRMMDEWIWTDAEVAALLRTRYVGVKIDGDVSKALVEKYGVNGYPTMIVLAGDGRERDRHIGSLSSKTALTFLNRP